MKKSSHVIVAALVAAVLSPVAVHAAKADRKNKNQPEQLPVAFATADSNGDGSVSKEEFVTALKEKLGEGGAASKFASLDKNSDGKLTKEEYSGAPEQKKRRKKDK
ncbi:MAG: EF-hand domain-containing protein [Opitutaceae bacterium]